MRSLLATGLVAVATVLGTWAAGSVATAAPAHEAVPGHAVTRAGVATTTGTFSLLSDTSCIAAGDCVAVGEHFAGHLTPIADKWNGSTWSAIAVHLPSGASSGFLISTSCKAGGCIAVGTDTRGSIAYGLAESFNGTSWSLTAQPAGVSTASQVILESVSCVTVKACVAVGYYIPKSNAKDDIAIAEVWNGSTWRLSAAPREPYGNLDTVSCPAANSCVLGGLYENSTGSYIWAEHFDGAHWSSIKVLQPTTPNNHVQLISGVSCSSTTSCVADGVTVNSSAHTTGFTEVLSGGVWKIEKVAWPAGQQSTLISVSCASATFCIADGSVGSSVQYTDGKAAFAAWDGTAWHLHLAPKPPAGFGNALVAVQCLSSTYCTLGGTQGKTGTATGVGLAGVLNGLSTSGTSWKWTLTP